MRRREWLEGRIAALVCLKNRERDNYPTNYRKAIDDDLERYNSQLATLPPDPAPYCPGCGNALDGGVAPSPLWHCTKCGCEIATSADAAAVRECKSCRNVTQSPSPAQPLNTTSAMKEAVEHVKDTVERLRESERSGEVLNMRLDASGAPAEPDWRGLVEEMADAIRMARLGYKNILEFRKLDSARWGERDGYGGRYGALTREELESAIAPLDAALDKLRSAKGGH